MLASLLGFPLSLSLYSTVKVTYVRFRTYPNPNPFFLFPFKKYAMRFFLLFSLYFPWFTLSMTLNTPNKRLRTTPKSSSSISGSGNNQESTKERVLQMAERAKKGAPFTEEEIQDICNGIQNLIPKDAPVAFNDLQKLLKEAAHLSHKDWSVTSKNSDKLCRTLSITLDQDSTNKSNHANQLLERILKDGNWQGAVKHSLNEGNNVDEKPWAVLVTGVNGIRKTTSMYQDWFQDLLAEAIITPSGKDSKEVKNEYLPTGQNSFFRQLDHMIATLMNEEFYKLYSWAASCLKEEGAVIPSEDIVTQYSDYKAAIFSRYRTLSELLGALLLKEAQKLDINCLMETSGKDVAMFHYVDHFFDASKYNKLALHFTINDLSQAKTSVDKRMIEEIQVGSKAVESGNAFDVIYANAGGPYGSKVLEGVQKDSDNVWDNVVLKGDVGEDWYKATINIQAHPTKPWTAQAVLPDGTFGTKFTFERKT